MASLRKSTVRITNVAGVVWEGDSATMPLAARALGRRALARLFGTVPNSEDGDIADEEGCR